MIADAIGHEGRALLEEPDLGLAIGALAAPLVNVNIPADLVTIDPCWTDRSVEG